jgi:hypothetical protein
MPRKTRRQKLHAEKRRTAPAVVIDSPVNASAPAAEIRYQFLSSAPKRATPAPAAIAEYQAVRADLVKTVAISILMITAIVTLARMWQ